MKLLCSIGLIFLLLQELGAARTPLKETVSLLRIEIQNQKQQLHIFQEKLHNQDLSIEQLRKETHEEQNIEKKTRTTNQGQVKSLEQFVKGLKKDALTLQKHANETSNSLQLLSEQILAVEKSLQSLDKKQNQIEKALNTLLDAVEEEELTYQVQFGDTLEKIARRHETTINSIKKRNQLKDDRILTGQNLIIPK